MGKDEGSTAEAEAPVEEASEEEQFRQEQKALAEQQNQSAENAVPEQRPIASQQMPDTDSELTKRLRDAGELGDNEPMGKECYDRAESKAQMKKAAQSSVSEAIKPGDTVKVTKGPHEGRVVAVTRIESFMNAAELAIKQAGVPESRFIQPQTIEGRALQDSRDGEILILNVEDAGLEVIPGNFTGLGRR